MILAKSHKRFKKGTFRGKLARFLCLFQTIRIIGDDIKEDAVFEFHNFASDTRSHQLIKLISACTPVPYSVTLSRGYVIYREPLIGFTNVGTCCYEIF